MAAQWACCWSDLPSIPREAEAGPVAAGSCEVQLRTIGGASKEPYV